MLTRRALAIGFMAIVAGFMTPAPSQAQGGFINLQSFGFREPPPTARIMAQLIQQGFVEPIFYPEITRLRVYSLQRQQFILLHAEQLAMQAELERQWLARRDEMLQQRRDAYQQWQQQRAAGLQNWQPPPPIVLSDEDRAGIKLKQARQFAEDGQKTDAVEYCHRVLKDYPATQAAQEARALLAKLKALN